MATITNLFDLQDLAQKRLPKIFFDYIDGGAFSQTSMRRNRDDFAQYELIQHVLRQTEPPVLAHSFLGEEHGLPFMLGPVGFLGLYRGKGEILAARAAKAKGVAMCLSTFSIASIGTLRDEVGGALHFQLYMDKDRGFVEKLLHAAQQAEIETLYLTVDTSVTSVREKDERNGFRSVTRLTLPLLYSMAKRPGWCLDMLKAGMPEVEALKPYPEFGKGALAQAAQLSSRLDPALSWQDVAWLRKQWQGRLVIKGILSPQDAQQAQKLGADAIVISNHGGRQLDYASSTIAALPDIRQAVGPDFEVLIDSGFRRGSEILIALALGADAILLGRAYAFGLAANGQAGVEKVIDILAHEISITLKLMGVGSIKELKELGDKAVKRR